MAKPSFLRLRYIRGKDGQMRPITGKGMNYQLYGKADEYILSIPHGGAAIQLFNMRLSAIEKEQYDSKGIDFLDWLEQDVRANFSKYKGRHLEINFNQP